MTATETESVSARTILRYRGPAVEHRFRWYPARNPSYRDGGLRGECDCGETRTIDGGHDTGDLVRLERQHAGVEDP